MLRLRGIFYRNIKDTSPTDSFDIPFTHEALSELFAFHDVSPDGKKHERLWSPVRLAPGASRSKSAVEESYALVLDKDCGDPGELKACIQALAATNLAYFVHTSFSHQVPGKERVGVDGPFDCFRVVIPYSRPITSGRELEAIYSWVTESVLPPEPTRYAVELHAAQEAAKRAKEKRVPKEGRGWDAGAGQDIARAWYVPGGPAEQAGHRVFEVRGGEPIPVDELIRAVEPEAAPKLAPTDSLLRCLKRFQDALRAHGKGFVDEELELDVEYRSDCPVCESHNTVSVKADSERNKITYNCYDTGCDPNAIPQAIGLTWLDLYPQKAEAPERYTRNAFGTGRSEPYTFEELADMAPLDELWVLQTAAGIFIRAPGNDYVGPFSRETAQNAARDLLAPAVSAGVAVTKTTKNGGLTLKSVPELLHEYGRTPPNVKYSYAVDRSRLVDDTFIQKAGRLRDIAPEFNEDIAQWLRLFAGEHEDALLDWLATLHRLDIPTAALCIAGTAGAGKDLLIDGIARFWGGRSMSVERATSRFNDDLLTTPLVVASEELTVSRDYGANAIDTLKKLISDRSRTIETKNMRAVTLEGAIRVIITTNRTGAFNLRRQPTTSDIQALDDRILLLRPPPEARDFLTRIGGISTTVGWVDGEGIARHVAWLRKTRIVTSGFRLLVQGRGGMSDLLASEGVGAAPVLRAILNAMLGSMRDDRVVRIDEGKVWVCKRALHEKWASYSRVELPEDMGKVWETIAVPGSSYKTRVGGRLGTQERYVQIQPPVLINHATNNGRLEELHEVLAGDVPTEKEHP